MASTCSQEPLSISVTRSRSASSTTSSSFVLHRTASADSADLAAIGGSAAEQFDSLVSEIRAKNDRRQRRAFYRSVVPQRIHRQVSLDQIDLDDVVDDFAVMSRDPSRTSSFGELPPCSPSLKKSSSVLSSYSSSSSLTVPDSSSSPMPAVRVRIRRANSDTVALDSPSGMHKKRVRANLAKAARNSVHSPGKKDIRVRNSVNSPDNRSSCPVSSPNKKSNSLTSRQNNKRSSEGMGKSSAGTSGKAKQNGFSWRSTGRSKRSRCTASKTQTEPDVSSATSTDNSSSSSQSISAKSTSSSVNKRRSRSRTPVREDSSSDESDCGESSTNPIFPVSSKPAAAKLKEKKPDDSLYPLFPPSFYPKPVLAAAPAKKRRSGPLSLSTSRRSSMLTEDKKRGFFFDSDSEGEDGEEAMADEDDALLHRSSSSSSSNGRFSSSLPSILENSKSPRKRTRKKPLAKNGSFSASQPVESTSSSPRVTKRKPSASTRRSPMKVLRSPNKRVRNDCSRLKESVSEAMGSPPKKARISRTLSQGTHTTAGKLSRANSNTRSTGNVSVNNSSKNGVVQQPRTASRKRALANGKVQATKQDTNSRNVKKPSRISSPQKQKQNTAVQKSKKSVSRRTALSLSKKAAASSSSSSPNWMDDEDAIEESLAPSVSEKRENNEKEVDVFALPDQDMEETIEVSAVRLTSFSLQRGMSSASLTDEPDSIRTMRMQNLSEKSNSALLLDALLQKHSRELQKVSRIASSTAPGIRSMSRLSRRTESIKFDLEEDYKILGKITPSLECTIMYLLGNGADPEYTDADGVFPLLVAVQYENSLRVVAKLLQSGASSERIFDDRSLVDVAWRLDQHLVCALLVKQNAFPTATSVKPGQATFLDYAKAHGFHHIAFQRMKSLLWEGVECHNEEWIESALRHGVPPSVRDNSDQTPLYVAVHSKAPGSLVRLLLSRGADPNIVDASRTPMMCFPLIRHGKDALGIINLLLKYSADTGARVGSTGQTLLDFAQESAADPNYHSLLKEAKHKNEQLQRKLHERKSSRTKKKT